VSHKSQLNSSRRSSSLPSFEERMSPSGTKKWMPKGKAQEKLSELVSSGVVNADTTVADLVKLDGDLFGKKQFSPEVIAKNIRRTLLEAKNIVWKGDKNFILLTIPSIFLTFIHLFRE